MIMTPELRARYWISASGQCSILLVDLAACVQR